MAGGSKKKGRNRHKGGPKTTSDVARNGSNATTEVTTDISEGHSEAQREQKEIPSLPEGEEDSQTKGNGSITEAPQESTVPAASPSEDVAVPRDLRPALTELNNEESDVVHQEAVMHWQQRYEEVCAELEKVKETTDVANRAKEKAEQDCIAERDRQSFLHQQLAEAAEVQESMATQAKEWEKVREALLDEVSALKGQLSEVEAECEKAQQSETTAIQDATSARDELQEMHKIQNTLSARCETLDIVEQKCEKLQLEKDVMESELEETRQLSASRLIELENVRRNEACLQSEQTRLEEESRENQALFESKLEAARNVHQDQEDQLTKLRETLAATEAECRQIGEEKENMSAALKEREEAEHAHQGKQEDLRNKLKAAVRKGKRIEEEKLALEAQHSDLDAQVKGLSSQVDDLTSQIAVWEEKQRLAEEQRAELEEELAREREVSAERQVALTQVDMDFAAFKTEWQLRLDEVEGMKNEVMEKENGTRTKLQSAVKKGKRIESEKQQLERQIEEMGNVISGIIPKVPEISVLKQQVVQLSTELASVELQLQNCVKEGADHRNEVLRLTKEAETLQTECSKAETAQKLLQVQLQEELDRNVRADMALEEATQRICDFEKEKAEMEDQRARLESTITGNETKLVRAREAIEALRKERSLLSEQHATLEQEVHSLRSENEAIIQQQDNPEESELEKKILEIEKAHRLAEKRLEEASDQLLETQEAKQKLEMQLTTLQEELQSSSNPPDHSADLQVIESLYQTATSVAQQLNLPFMETASLSNGDMSNAQLQAVQVLLEGTSVGIKKTQEQLAQLPAVMGELESSKSTIRHLEEELVGLKKEAVTPASSSTVDIPTTSLSTPYAQMKGIKRRELQEPTMADSHVIDLDNGVIEGETESKTGEYTPLISIQALRSAPPPVLHFMQSLDHQTQGAGRLLGHQPIARVGVLAYVVALHVLLFILMV